LCFEDVGSLCGVCSLWVLSCSGVFPRFNAVVDLDMGILLLVLDFQVMLYLNVNCLCWAWSQKLSSSVFCLWIGGNFVSQGFRFLLPNWLGCHCIFQISGMMCWWRVAMFGLWHPESLCLCFLPQYWSGYGLGMSMMTGSVFYYSLRMSLT
jgi:hypothetical protein